jgi:hypothetical protein
MAALEAFANGGALADVAYVAEQVLTADELKSFVDRLPWSEEIAAKMDEAVLPEHEKTAFLRRLLARHLVRAKRYDEAMPYLTPYFRERLTKYVEALRVAQNTKLPKLERARAYYRAAAILHISGMELIGTYDQTFRLNRGHAYPPYTIALEREYAKVERIKYEDLKTRRTLEPLKLHVPATSAERKRLATRRMAPAKPQHYLYTAAAHGWSAAQLLPDQTEELADLLNTCGRWIQNDAPAADKFFQAIERRASKTEIGKAAGARHWFVTQTGPWSGETQQQ